MTAPVSSNSSADGFVQRTQRLRADLASQGRRVQALLEAAFAAIFSRDAQAAKAVATLDDAIDAVDVELEKACVQLLADATRQGAELAPAQLREVLTIVKVNNELERVADIGVELADMVIGAKLGGLPFPDTFRVMANSVIGIVRDAITSVHKADPSLANIVLQSQHAVSAFKDAVLRDAEDKLSKGLMPADFAFGLHEVATACEVIADHCTNVAEQVIYQTTGSIVRHATTGWGKVGG
ncbi:MAG: hypothetical protein JNK25_10890 [Phycisphaerae bacterium]|nr:hypothetical protein [Phycisphaerae bacterium]